MAHKVPKSMRAHLLMLDRVPSAPTSRFKAFEITGNRVLMRPPSMLSLIVADREGEHGPWTSLLILRGENGRWCFDFFYCHETLSLGKIW